MTRKECLDLAAQAVLSDRANAYGPPEQNFRSIAYVWSWWLNAQIKPHDVAVMLDLVKTARLRHNPTHMDNWVDKAGYAACGAEVSCERSD